MTLRHPVGLMRSADAFVDIVGIILKKFVSISYWGRIKPVGALDQSRESYA